MLDQVNHWVDVAATAVDCLLLLRILTLKLFRPYVFVTLFALLAVLFDGVMLWLGPDSREFLRVFLYSRFLYALVFPAVAYDVFEEAKGQVAKFRKLGLRRLVSSIILAAVFGFLVAGFGGVEQESGGDATLATVALVVWAAAATASMAFLWSMRRAIRTQKMEVPRNTSVFMVFFSLAFAMELLSCLFDVAIPLLNAPLSGAIQLAINAFGIAITTWCILKLRAMPSDMQPEPEKAGL
ncbi:MAG: hypothetical protein JO033_21775 [Acidobacteriaceae bacterium]|nr:hypothetical protein [Acidobacteriaceae bacterium]MBV9497883.1 hypothetical protein [Acidobacteriaceae bacterium]